MFCIVHETTTFENNAACTNSPEKMTMTMASYCAKKQRHQAKITRTTTRVVHGGSNVLGGRGGKEYAERKN